MTLTLPLTIALSKKNMHLAWFTTTRPLNKYKTRTQHRAENGMVWLILQTDETHVLRFPVVEEFLKSEKRFDKVSYKVR